MARKKFRIPMKEDPEPLKVLVRTSPCDVCGTILAIDKPGWVITGSKQFVCYSKEANCIDKILADTKAQTADELEYDDEILLGDDND